MERHKKKKRRGRGLGASASREKLTAKVVLDKLDAVDDRRFRNRRASDRHRFRRTLVPIRVRHPGGSISDSRVATRNLSNTGVGFLYNGFLHSGTEVLLTLPRRDGSSDALEGRVVHCAHVAGAFHQVGVRFDRKIVAKHYIKDATGDSRLATEITATNAMNFTGKLLMIDAQPMDRALVAHHFRGTQAQVVAVDSLAAALDHIVAAGEDRFDAMLCEVDVDTPGEGLRATLTAIRNAGHLGPIVIATPTTATPTVRRAFFEVGAVAVMTKPYDRAELQAALSHGIGADGMDRAIEAAERGIDEVDALTKSVDAARRRRRS